MAIDQYLAGAGIEIDALEGDLKVQAEQSVREELALEALFRAKGMEVTDEDVDQEIAELASSTESTIEEARKRWADLGLMAVVREQIMHRKATMWLLENTTVTEESGEASAEGSNEGTKKAAPKKRASKAKKKAEPAEAESTEAEQNADPEE
jgi:trigger factor